MARGVDEPGDVVDPGAAQRAAPHQRRQAPARVQSRKHGHHVETVRALDEAVEGLDVQVPRVPPRAHALQRGLSDSALLCQPCVLCWR